MNERSNRCLAVILAAVLVGICAAVPRVGHAQDNGPGASDSAGQANAAVFLIPENDKTSRTTLSTLLVILENAFADNPKVEIIDIESRLAKSAGKVPEDRLIEARTRFSGAEGALNPQMAEAAAAEFADVLSGLQKILAYVPRDELARIHYALGAAHAIAGDRKRAVAAFERLASWNPGYQSPAPYAKGRVDAAWQKARSKVAKGRKGSLSLTSEPAGAMAYIDGQFVGFTPLTSEDLSRGTHYVTFRIPGYYRVIKSARVRGRKARKVKATLKPAARADELRLLVGAVGAGIDAEDDKGPSALKSLRALLGVDEVIAVRVPDRSGKKPTFRAARFSTESGRRLNLVSAPYDDDLQTLLEDLTRSLYTDVTIKPEQEVVETPVKPRRPGKKRFYQRWWFWTTVSTAAAIGVGVPLVFSLTGDDPPCPIGSTCGRVIWQF